VRKSGRGPLFSCFIAFLFYNFSKSFEGVHELPPSSPHPLCASMVQRLFSWAGFEVNISFYFLLENLRQLFFFLHRRWIESFLVTCNAVSFYVSME
jgi:hypothetical protein